LGENSQRLLLDGILVLEAGLAAEPNPWLGCFSDSAYQRRAGVIRPRIDRWVRFGIAAVVFLVGARTRAAAACVPPQARDALHRITQVTYAAVAPWGSIAVTTQYDEFGRVQQTTDATDTSTLTYDDLNQLTTATPAIGQSASYTYISDQRETVSQRRSGRRCRYRLAALN
jgi:YD repeat-containing protein